MSIDNWAKLGLAVVAFGLTYYLRRNRSAAGQSFSCQVGDQVFTGRFQLTDGEVRVTSDGLVRSAPLGMSSPLHVAERLLAEMHAEKPGQ